MNDGVYSPNLLLRVLDIGVMPPCRDKNEKTFSSMFFISEQNRDNQGFLERLDLNLFP